MYSEAAIEHLKNRIGFGDETIAVNIDTDHKIGTSGRLFSYFHKLVTLQNLYDTVSEINTSESDFNEYLEQLKTDASKGALTRLLNLNERYLNDFDYSDTIINHPELFDDVYGYTLAITAIEQMVSTNRVNDSERNASLTYNKLKMELEGITDNNGRVFSKGITRELTLALKRATNVIFPPKPLIIENSDFW